MVTKIFQQAGLALAITAASTMSANAGNTVAPDSNITDLFSNGDLTEFNNLIYMQSDWIIDVESVNDENVDRWIDDLYELTRSDPTHPIIVRLGESPGGSTREGLNFIDALHAVPNPIVAVCTENAHSMGGAILYSLRNGLRLSTENCNIMTHEPFWPNLGRQSFSSLEHLLENGRRTRDAMVQYTADASGLSLEDSLKLYTSHDLHLTPRQAMGAGLIDAIIPHRTDNEFARNRITMTSGTSSTTLSITTESTAEDFKDLFCEATSVRQLDYCLEDSAPSASQVTEIQSNNLEQAESQNTPQLDQP
jgi:ATP-dependent protease ClpP protease subunit